MAKTMIRHKINCKMPLLGRRMLAQAGRRRRSKLGGSESPTPQAKPEYKQPTADETPAQPESKPQIL